jgi:hypothetical protein
LFLQNDFKKENELRLADEAKAFLKLKINERTDENLKAIIFFINFIVPEFADLPVALQYRMAQVFDNFNLTIWFIIFWKDNYYPI